MAALNINIFVKHADRLKLANIAQMINVLQAMILTKDEKMVLTPTYQVFEMFEVVPGRHSPAGGDSVCLYNKDASTLPAVTASAVRDKDGRLHIALVNVDPSQPATITAQIPGGTQRALRARADRGGNQRPQHVLPTGGGEACGLHRRGDRVRRPEGDATAEVSGGARPEIAGR